MGEQEIWKDINGYEGFYQISNLGRVKSIARTVSRIYNKTGIQKIPEKILQPIFLNSGSGYYMIGLYKNSEPELFLIHRLVAFAFIPNPENKPQVNHIKKDENGKINTFDNRVTSIEWATGKENVNHAWENGMCDNVRETARKMVIQRNSRKVVDNITQQVYNSAKEAALKNGIDADKLTAMLRRDYLNTTSLRYSGNDKKQTFGKTVLNNETGIFYDSCKDAAISKGMKGGTLRAMLNGQNTNTTSFIYV